MCFVTLPVFYWMLVCGVSNGGLRMLDVLVLDASTLGYCDFDIITCCIRCAAFSTRFSPEHDFLRASSFVHTVLRAAGVAFSVRL